MMEIVDMGIGDQIRELIQKRLQIQPDQLVCPREKSEMTPCVARDGDSALDEHNCCVGCGMSAHILLKNELDNLIG